jgi:ABC-type transporter Mla maintaining outer membrane lipid asymmetry ATPase subunit MlaF
MVVRLEVATEDMIVVEEVAATIRDPDRTSAVATDRADMDVEGVDMASKAEMGMVSRVEMGMVSRVAMAMAMEVDMEGMEAVTLEVVMVADAVAVGGGDTRSEMTRRKSVVQSCVAG